MNMTEKGFTLVELLIAMAISGVIMAGVYAAFKSQQDSYLAQEQVAEMQQNIRAGLYIMVTDLRMAGYDPTSTAGSGITVAKSGQISFTLDENGDGDTSDTNEAFDYGFTPATSNSNYDVARNGIPDVDSNGDGVPDAMPLGRQISSAGGYKDVAENIQAIEFYYLDNQQNVTAVPADISSVQISILARARRPDINYTDTKTYPTVGTTPGGATWGPFNDNFRRRFQTMTVKCRNMGL